MSEVSKKKRVNWVKKMGKGETEKKEKKSRKTLKRNGGKQDGIEMNHIFNTRKSLWSKKLELIAPLSIRRVYQSNLYIDAYLWPEI